MIEHECGDEVGVLALHGAQSEDRHRLRHIHLDHLLPASGDGARLRDGDKISGGWEIAEDLVKQRTELFGIDVANGNHLQRILGKNALAIALQIIARDLSNRLLGAGGGASIRMALKGNRVPFVEGDFFGIAGRIGQGRLQLLADALHRIRIETRSVDGELQELGGLVTVGRKRLEIPVKRVLGILVAHAHGDLLHALLKLPGLQIACALIQHRGEKISETFVAGRILRTPTLEGKAHGHHGHGMLLDKPGLDAAGTLYGLDFHSVCRPAERGDNGEDQGGKRHCRQSPQLRGPCAEPTIKDHGMTFGQ